LTRREEFTYLFLRYLFIIDNYTSLIKIDLDYDHKYSTIIQINNTFVNTIDQINQYIYFISFNTLFRIDYSIIKDPEIVFYLPKVDYFYLKYFILKSN
jgi:hypothetical protein